MSLKCEPKVALLCKKYGMSYRLRPLRFGFERIEIECDSYAILDGLRSELRKIKGAAVDSACHFMGQFSGRITVLDADDEEELDALLKEERDRIEEWWQRYHAADEETRRLMACGAIA